jgi:hypothetical protein
MPNDLIPYPPSKELKKFSVYLPPGSLLFLTGELYTHYLHTIEPVLQDSWEELEECVNWQRDGEDISKIKTEKAEDCDNDATREISGLKRARRISLTFRRVRREMKVRGWGLG